MSLRAAINAKCRDCIYDPSSGLGNWRQQVTGCTCTDCPLYPVRPVSQPENKPSRRGKSGPEQKQNDPAGTAPQAGAS